MLSLSGVAMVHLQASSGAKAASFMGFAASAPSPATSAPSPAPAAASSTSAGGAVRSVSTSSTDIAGEGEDGEGAELDVDPVRDREGSQLAAGDLEEEGTDDQFVDEQLEEREGRLRGGFDEEDEEVDSRLYGLERVGGDGDEKPTVRAVG
ncbi:MAG: hypothetical protein WDW38_005844 [Sanguina aurantia]